MFWLEACVGHFSESLANSLLVTFNQLEAVVCFKNTNNKEGEEGEDEDEERGGGGGERGEKEEELAEDAGRGR